MIMWSVVKLPDTWLMSFMIPSQNKGSGADYDDYQEISLLKSRKNQVNGQIEVLKRNPLITSATGQYITEKAN